MTYLSQQFQLILDIQPEFNPAAIIPSLLWFHLHVYKMTTEFNPPSRLLSQTPDQIY